MIKLSLVCDSCGAIIAEGISAYEVRLNWTLCIAGTTAKTLPAVRDVSSSKANASRAKPRLRGGVLLADVH